jgi:hypothetical protein
VYTNYACSSISSYYVRWAVEGSLKRCKLSDSQPWLAGAMMATSNYYVRSTSKLREVIPIMEVNSITS